jgi:hypothetical protein
MRRGAFPSMIVVELVWLCMQLYFEMLCINPILMVVILWVLWVATAGEAAYVFNFYFPLGCIYGAYSA